MQGIIEALNRLLELFTRWLNTEKRKKKHAELDKAQDNPAQWYADTFGDGVVRDIDGQPIKPVNKAQPTEASTDKPTS